MQKDRFVALSLGHVLCDGGPVKILGSKVSGGAGCMSAAPPPFGVDGGNGGRGFGRGISIHEAGVNASICQGMANKLTEKVAANAPNHGGRYADARQTSSSIRAIAAQD